MSMSKNFTIYNIKERTTWSLDMYEQELINKGLLYFGKRKNKESIGSANVIQFINKEFFELNKICHTYSVKNNSKICENNCYRSNGDIFRICKYYFPETSLKEIIGIVNSKKELTNSICSTIHKRVYRQRESFEMGRLSNYNTVKDEFGRTIKEHERDCK